MALNDRKITQTDIQTYGLQAVSEDRILDQSVRAKQLFDRLIQLGVMPKFNNLIDDLLKETTVSGAEQIGCSAITGINNNQSGKIRDFLVDLRQQLVDVSQGSVADGAITNQKLSTDAVMLSLLTGYIIPASTSALSSNDNVRQALGKIERQIQNILDGTTNADTANNFSSTGGIATALNAKQNTLSFDNTPTENSQNPVSSNGIYQQLTLKSNKPVLIENSSVYFSQPGILHTINYNFDEEKTLEIYWYRGTPSSQNIEIVSKIFVPSNPNFLTNISHTFYDNGTNSFENAFFNMTFTPSLLRLSSGNAIIYIRKICEII